jgi:hypothetical protein
MPTSFPEQMVEYSSAIMGHKELTYGLKEQMAYLFEGMTNIDTDAKLKVFYDMTKVEPRLDYEQIASTLKR